MRPKGSIEITARDIRIMQFAFEQRAISSEQIRQRFFGMNQSTSVYRRLRGLVNDKYMSRIGIYHNGAMTNVFGLMDKGFQRIRQGYRHEITHPYFKSDSPLHDIGLTAIRARLEKYDMFACYVSENMLQACHEFANSTDYQPYALINSDAALVLKGPTKEFRVALEFEASDKKGFRYTKKLMQYYMSPEIVAVFYVCRDRHIENLIRVADAEFASQFESKIYTCLEEVVHRSTTPLPFTNRINTTFLLK